MTRREFCLRGARTIVLSGYLSNISQIQGQQSLPSQPNWWEKPMRWAQLVLVENDPGRFDPQFWLDYFRKVEAEGVCLSAGGCVAYYPTEIPYHHRSKWLGNSDPFGELVHGCRQMGMVVIARTDPHSALQDVYHDHPDWLEVDAKGQPRPHWATPGRWLTCTLGPYNFEFMTEVHKEIMSKYMVDGIFINRWAQTKLCYCIHCRRNFREATGLSLPEKQDLDDERWRRYLSWRQQRYFELWELWEREVRKINPNARVIPNTGGGALFFLDMKHIAEKSSILFMDRQARRGVMPPWASGKNAKEYRGALGMKPVGGIFSVGVEEPYRWKDSVQNGAEIKLWVANGLANGMRPWFVKFSGTLYDRRWLKTVEEIYTWHHRHERYFRNLYPIARVALVYSQQTGWYYGGRYGADSVEGAIRGWYHALVESRIPFEMIHDGFLTEERLKPFKLLILPNIACLSDEQCEQIKAFVARGGSLIATFETSLYNELGIIRTDFALGELFGAYYRGHTIRRMQNSYLKLQRNPRTGQFYPILEGLEDAYRIINGVQRAATGPRIPYPDAPLTLIPTYPDLPMEEVYPRVEESHQPELYIRQLENGSRIVYFPWDIDRTFWEVLSVDHLKLMRNAVRWALNEPPLVNVDGPGFLDVTLWRQQDSMTVHLVNMTNPMAMKGPVREIIPVGPLNVRIRLPEAWRPRRVYLLEAETTPETRLDNDHLEVRLQQVKLHEVIAIDF